MVSFMATHDGTMTSLLWGKDVATSFSRFNDVIVVLGVGWGATMLGKYPNYQSTRAQRAHDVIITSL